jgi:adenylate cyclase class 2
MRIPKERFLAFEIELKARIDEPELVRSRLDSLGIYECAYEKEDRYWFFASPEAGGPEKAGKPPSLSPPGLRIRRETRDFPDGRCAALCLAAYKSRKLQEGVEINDEREFEISDAEAFEELLRRLGLEPRIAKHKRGRAWYCGGGPEQGPEAGIRAELSELRGLGWFLELEILSLRGDEKTITQCRERLFSVLEKLEIPPETIESRPYTEMLKSPG